MRLSYASLFPDKVKHPWCKRKRLTAKNAYQLPAGDYCLYDLYPLSGIAEPDIYLTVEGRKEERLEATLRCLLYGDKAVVSLSPEHLQSVQAPEICQMVNDLLNEDSALRKRLTRRKAEVQAACQTVASASDVPESNWLSETAIRKLAGTLEMALQASDEDSFESLIDQLLHNLKESLKANYRQQQTSTQDK